MITGESKALYYGGRCEKYETDDRKKNTGHIPNLFARDWKCSGGDFAETPVNGKTTIGIPRAR